MESFPEIVFITLVIIAFVFSYFSHDIINGLLIFAIAVLIFYLFSFISLPKVRGFKKELDFILKSAKGKFFDVDIPLSKFFDYFKEYLDRSFVSFVNFEAMRETEKFLKMREVEKDISVLMPGEFKELMKTKGGIIRSYVVVTYRNPIKTKYAGLGFRISNNKIISIFCYNRYICELIKAKFKISYV